MITLNFKEIMFFFSYNLECLPLNKPFLLVDKWNNYTCVKGGGGVKRHIYLYSVHFLHWQFCVSEGGKLASVLVIKH